MISTRAPWDEDEDLMKARLSKAPGINQPIRFDRAYAEMKLIRLQLKGMDATAPDTEQFDMLIQRAVNLFMFCERRIAAVRKLVEAERERVLGASI